MERQGRTCPQCSGVVSPRDTILVRNRHLVHLDCTRPRMLSADERAVLLSFCVDHTVAQCLACASSFHLGELSADSLAGRSYLCPQCRRDLTENVRAHLYGCRVMPVIVRSRAVALREAAWNLVKQSQQLHDTADVLMHEAEVLLDKTQRALRRSLRGAGEGGDDEGSDR